MTLHAMRNVSFFLQEEPFYASMEALAQSLSEGDVPVDRRSSEDIYDQLRASLKEHGLEKTDQLMREEELSVLFWNPKTQQVESSPPIEDLSHAALCYWSSYTGCPRSFEKLFKSQDSQVRFNLARNENTPINILLELEKDPDLGEIVKIHPKYKQYKTGK